MDPDKNDGQPADESGDDRSSTGRSMGGSDSLLSALKRAQDLLSDDEVAEPGWFGDRDELVDDIAALLRERGQ